MQNCCAYPEPQRYIPTASRVMGVLTSNFAFLLVRILSMKCTDWASQTWLHVIITRGAFEKVSVPMLYTGHLTQSLEVELNCQAFWKLTR